METSDFTWKPGVSSKGAHFMEADLTDYFAHRLGLDEYDDDYHQWFTVTVRKYSQNYYLAYVIDDPDDPDASIWEYTQDGNGDGLIRIAPVMIFRKVDRVVFEMMIDEYLDAFHDHLNGAVFGWRHTR